MFNAEKDSLLIVSWVVGEKYQGVDEEGLLSYALWMQVGIITTEIEEDGP